MTAQVDVLAEGYVGDRVASTVTLIRDGEVAIVVDPGMVASRGAILEPLAALGVQVGEVTDVVFSHHHPDHTLNAALFPNARFHDFWAIYQDDRWDDRDADGFQLSPAARLMSLNVPSPWFWKSSDGCLYVCPVLACVMVSWI